MKDDKYHFPTARQAEIWAKLDAEAELAALWLYTDRDGLEAFRVFELEREEDQRRMLRTAWLVPPGYRVDEPPRPWPLYRLPELTRGGQIYVCQSEASVDRLRETGLLATTSAHGIGGVSKTDWSPLAGREVILLPDNNETGRALARRVTAALVRLSPPAMVRVLALPGLGKDGTVRDFIDMRHPRELRAIGSEIADLAEVMPEHWRVRPHEPTGLGWPAVPTPLALAGPGRQRQWLWPGRLEAGRLNLLLGPPGTVQSRMAADLAARITTATPWPDGSAPARRRSVLLLADAQRLSDTIRPALEAAGADLQRVLTLPMAEPAAGSWPAVAALDCALSSEPDVRLVVIDPYSAYFQGNSRAALAALDRVAAQHRAAILMVGTLSGRTGGFANMRSGGSGHALALASCAWLGIPDGREADRWLMLPARTNPASPDGPAAGALAWRNNADGTLAWEPGPAEIPELPEARLGGRGSRGGRGFAPAKRRSAAQWLLARLASGLDSPPRVEAAAAGYSWITIRRARADIGAISEWCAEKRRYRWRLEARD